MSTRYLVAGCIGAGLILLQPFFCAAFAQTIALTEQDATVWAQEQVITGAVYSDASQGTLHVLRDRPEGMTEELISFSVAEGGSFAVPLRFEEGTSHLFACTDASACSDTVRYELGFSPRPEGSLEASVSGRHVTLAGRLLEKPDSTELSFAWQQDAGNPQQLTLTPSSDSAASVAFPADVPHGEYYFGWQLSDADEDTMTARTFVTVDSAGITPFDIASDHAQWVDDAMIYEVPPFLFSVGSPSFAKITAKIPEIARLGANVLWLQPVYPFHYDGNSPSQAYGVTDYFSLSDLLGPEAQAREELRELIETARAHGMKVMFDFVAKHTDIQYSYAQDAIAHGETSHYYDFYMRELPPDSQRYSHMFSTLTRDNMTFVYSFYEDLVDLNYDNPEVERLIIEATRYWVEEFDIDGYRFDAVWGVADRDPTFIKRWRRALKRVKPSIFLLAEAKATNDALFDESFDAAYDWSDDTNYISYWPWQRTDARTETIFNSGLERYRSRNLGNALSADPDGYHSDARILRFMENNDMPRFRANHSLAQTRMAASLLFSLPGIPMIYYMQEVGTPNRFPKIYSGKSIRSYREYYGNNNLWWHYQDLMATRKAFPAMRSQNFQEIEVLPEGTSSNPGDEVDDYVFAYRRWEGSQNVLGVINMGDHDATASLQLPTGDMNIAEEETYYVTDLLEGTSMEYTGSELSQIDIDLDAHSTRLFILADSAVVVPSSSDPAPGSGVLPQAVELRQNFPNPFDDETTIRYALSRPAHVQLTVYDALGRRIVSLIDERQGPGRKSASFEAHSLSSGVYFYRLHVGETLKTKKMVVAR